MKKILAILVVLLLAVAAFAGCAREVPIDDTAPTEAPTEAPEEEDAPEATEAPKLMPEEGAELTYWALDEAHALAVAEAFEAETGVKVNVELVGFDSMTKLVLEGPAGNAGDVLWAMHSTFLQGYDSGVLLAFDEQFASNIKSEQQPAAVSAVTGADGKIYGAPYTMESIAMLYNKDLVAEPAGSIEEILANAEAFNVPEENKFYFMMPPTSYYMYGVLSTFGFEIYGPEGKDVDNPGYDSPAVLEGLKWIKDYSTYLPIPSQDMKMEGAALMQQSFLDGKIAYFVTGPWAIKAMNEGGVNYGVAPLPTVNGVNMRPFSNVFNIHVNAYTEYPIAAQMFADFIASEQGAQILYDAQKKISARIDNSQISGLADDEVLQAFLKQAESTFPTPNVARMSYYWQVVEPVLGAVFDGELEPEAGQQKIVDDYNALVASE